MKRVAEAYKEVVGNSRSGESRPGLWEGRVEDINDPRRLDRIRVRVFTIHGDKRSTPTSALPWAQVAELGGGGYDYGSAGALYPNGSDVWVMFRQGDDRFPVVTGGRRGEVLYDDKNSGEKLTVDGRSPDDITDTWIPPAGSEHPKDIFDESADGDTLPTRSVWHKSYRGHTILVEDRAGQEFLKIIDRAGQVIEMNCPVTEENNANNAQQRGARNASNDTQLPQDVLVNQKAFIRLKDVGGNEIILDGSGGNERILINGNNRQGTSKQTIEISSAKGKEKIQVTDKQGNSILIDPNNPPRSVVVRDFSGNELVFNAEAGQVVTRATTMEVHEVGGVDTEIKSDRNEIVGGTDHTQVAGNKFLEVLNDLSASIAGMSSLVFGGAVQATIANSPASGVPAPTALSVEIALGAFALRTQVNAVPLSISTLAGDIEITTLAGNIKMSTLVGLAEFGSASAQTTIKGPLGILLGSPAPFSICYGEATAAAFTAVGAAGAADIRMCLGIPVPPTALAALPAALTALTAPGVLHSILNKTQ